MELLPIKEGEATENLPAESPCPLCPERGPKKQLADTLFIEKREAREIGLHRASHWSKESPRKQDHPLLEKSPGEKSGGKREKSGKQPKNWAAD